MKYSHILKCGTLVAGGGLFGCGFAAATPGATLVDENNAPGGDFVLSLAQYGRESFEAPAHPLAEKFQTSLLERNAYSEKGLLRQAALAPELCAWLLDAGVEPRLGAGLYIDEDGAIVIADADGLTRVECGAFHDLRNIYAGAKRFFHALIDFGETHAVSGGFPGFTLSESAIPGNSILSIELDPDCRSWSDARRRLREVWTRRPDELASGRIAWSAASFAYKRYSGPVHALDAGLRSGEAAK